MQTWGVKDALQPTLASSVGLNVQRTSVVGCCSAARIVVPEMMDEPCKPQQALQAHKAASKSQARKSKSVRTHKATSKAQATVIPCPA